jgi:hypothetical protein
MTKSGQNLAVIKVSIANGAVTITVAGIRQQIVLAGIAALTLLAALYIYITF